MIKLPKLKRKRRKINKSKIWKDYMRLVEHKKLYPLSIKDIAKKHGVTRAQVYKIINKKVGIKPIPKINGKIYKELTEGQNTQIIPVDFGEAMNKAHSESATQVPDDKLFPGRENQNEN